MKSQLSNGYKMEKGKTVLNKSVPFYISSTVKRETPSVTYSARLLDFEYDESYFENVDGVGTFRPLKAGKNLRMNLKIGGTKRASYLFDIEEDPLAVPDEVRFSMADDLAHQKVYESKDLAVGETYRPIFFKDWKEVLVPYKLSYSKKYVASVNRNTQFRAYKEFESLPFVVQFDDGTSLSMELKTSLTEAKPASKEDPFSSIKIAIRNEVGKQALLQARENTVIVTRPKGYAIEFEDSSDFTLSSASGTTNERQCSFTLHPKIYRDYRMIVSAKVDGEVIAKEYLLPSAALLPDFSSVRNVLSKGVGHGMGFVISGFLFALLLWQFSERDRFLDLLLPIGIGIGLPALEEGVQYAVTLSRWAGLARMWTDIAIGCAGFLSGYAIGYALLFLIETKRKKSKRLTGD
ncbi:MAG: hypothetical protein ACI32C_02670 [Candidatus Enteromonas sp.]